MQNVNDYLFQQGLDRYKRLVGDPKFLPWHFQRVSKPEEVENYAFYGSEVTFDTWVEVDTTKIVGTSHCSYNDRSWIENIGSLKGYKDRERKGIEEMIHESRPGITLSKYGDKYFISEGNHRTTFAKFLGFKSLRVNTVQNYLFDQFNFDLVRRFERTGYKVLQWKDQIHLKSFQHEVIMYPKFAEEFLSFFDKVELNKSDLLLARLFGSTKYIEEYSIRFDTGDYHREERKSLKKNILIHKVLMRKFGIMDEKELKFRSGQIVKVLDAYVASNAKSEKDSVTKTAMRIAEDSFLTFIDSSLLFKLGYNESQVSEFLIELKRGEPHQKIDDVNMLLNEIKQQLS